MAAGPQARALFEAALELAPDQRQAFLLRACAGDEALLRRVSRLLAFDQAEAPEPHSSVDIEAESARQIGGWRLGECLGRGGMGEVWAAERGSGPLLQRGALKRVEIGDDPVRARRFLTECQALLRLRHPHIVRLIDAGQDGAGHAFAVMERVEGQTLLRHVELHRLTLRQRMQLFAQLCSAVAAAHQALLIHRDLKPGNVLVDAAGQVRLLDFGIARALDLHTGDLTQTTDRAFTPDYAAPEQYRGGADSAATDVHALGVVLYELICGQRPRALAGLGPVSALAVLEGPMPTAPSSRLGASEPLALEIAGGLDRRLLRDLDAICLKSLRPEPELRYPHAGAVLADLQRALEGVAVEARRGQLGYRWGRALRRRWRPLAATAAAAVLVTASAAWILSSREQTEREQDRSERLARVLSQTIEAADPRSGIGLGSAAPTLLADSSQRIDEELAAEPRLRAELKRVVGEALLALGMPRAALPQLAEASGLLKSQPPPSSWFEAMESQGRAAALAGDSGLAAEIFGEALQHDPAPQQRLRLELGQQALAVEQGRYADALNRLPELRAGLRQALGEAHPAHLRALSLEVHARVALSHLAQAQPLNDELAALQARVLPAHHPSHASTLWRQSDLARRMGQGERALALAEQTVERFADIYGAESAAMVSALTVRANAEQAVNRPAAAVVSTEAALRLAQRHYAPEEPVRAMLEFNLAGLLRDGLGRNAEAEQHFRAAIALAEGGGRATHPTRGLFSLSLAQLLNDQGRYVEALREVEAAAACFAADNTRQFDLRIERAIADAALGRRSAAERALAATLPDLIEARGNDDPSTRRGQALYSALTGEPLASPSLPEDSRSARVAGR